MTSADKTLRDEIAKLAHIHRCSSSICDDNPSEVDCMQAGAVLSVVVEHWNAKLDKLADELDAQARDAGQRSNQYPVHSAERGACGGQEFAFAVGARRIRALKEGQQ